MEQWAGGEAELLKKPWAKRLKAFKATANSYKALKHEARHGGTRTGIDKPLMTLPEARESMLQAVRSWIQEVRAAKSNP
jgi:hypothetical protein